MLNFVYSLLYTLRKGYWFVFQPITLGVKVVCINEKKQVLLVKHRYEDPWYLPGGGVKKRETIFDSAKREIKEEVGLNVNELEFLSIYSNFREYKSDHVALLLVNIANAHPVKGMEIEQLSFFDLNGLPETISPATKRRLEEYQTNSLFCGKW